MADGLRVYHPRARHCTVQVPHPGDPRSGRRAKTYHIHVDETGHGIISERVWTRLQQAEAWGGVNHGFTLVGHVPDPPRQGIMQPGAPKNAFAGKDMVQLPDEQYMIDEVSDALRQIAPKGTTTLITTRRKL